MLRGIDHVVIVVRNLAVAVGSYERAGFTVTPGGEHAGGATHNALIPFADGTYFELIAFREPDQPQEHPWWPRLAQGEGLVDYALLADDLAAEAERLRARGLAMLGPLDGGRRRPDGEELAWRSVRLGRGVSRPALPFVIEDVTPRELRVPGGPAARHRLPVRRIAGLTLVVSDLGEHARALEALLGTGGSPVLPGNQQSGIGERLRFRIGDHWLDLARPAGESGPAGSHLARFGEGPYGVVLSADSAAGTAVLPADLTHGAHIRIAPE